MSNIKNTLKEKVRESIAESKASKQYIFFKEEIDDLTEEIVSDVVRTFQFHITGKGRPKVIFISEDAELLARAYEIITGEPTELELKDWIDDAEQALPHIKR